MNYDNMVEFFKEKYQDKKNDINLEWYYFAAVILQRGSVNLINLQEHINVQRGQRDVSPLEDFYKKLETTAKSLTSLNVLKFDEKQNSYTFSSEAYNLQLKEQLVEFDKIDELEFKKTRHKEILESLKSKSKKTKEVSQETIEEDPLKEELDDKLYQKQTDKKSIREILNDLKPFLPNSEYNVLSSSIREHVDALQDVIKQVEDAKHSKDENIAYLHYFSGGSDWYINNIDENNIAFGYTMLNGDIEMAEFGYIDINEITSLGVELDLYYEPAPFKEVIDDLHKQYGYFREDDTNLTLKDIVKSDNDFVNKHIHVVKHR